MNYDEVIICEPKRRNIKASVMELTVWKNMKKQPPTFI